MVEESTDVIFVHPEDEHKYQKRRNSLTDDDLDGIWAIVDAVLKQHAHNTENCRFGDITPADLKAMVEAHKSFNAAMKDSKTVVRRFIIIAMLGGATGIAIYGWWSKVVDTVKKSLGV